MSDTFSIKNGLKQGGDLLPLLLNFALAYAIRNVGMFRQTRSSN